jgi:hypothetical protein
VLHPPINDPIVLHPHDWCAQLTAFSNGTFRLAGCLHDSDACRIEIPRFAGEANERVYGIIDPEIRHQSHA